MKRTKEQAEQTRDDILSAAEAMFHRHGLSRPSLEDIAQEAGVTRGAIYWHFKNKHELFTAMCERVDLPLEAAFGADCRDQKRPLATLHANIVNMLTDTADDPQRKKVSEILAYKCELVDENADLVQRRLDAHRKSMDCIADLLEQAVRQGELSPQTDVPFAASMVHSFLAGVMGTWALHPGRLDAKRDAQSIADLALGIAQQCCPREASRKAVRRGDAT